MARREAPVAYDDRSILACDSDGRLMTRTGGILRASGSAACSSSLSRHLPIARHVLVFTFLFVKWIFAFPIHQGKRPLCRDNAIHRDDSRGGVSGERFR